MPIEGERADGAIKTSGGQLFKTRDDLCKVDQVAHRADFCFASNCRN